VSTLDPVTRHVVTRAKELRRAANMTQQDLADAMWNEGVRWRRGTVVHTETGKREAVSVQELACLARVFKASLFALLPPNLCPHCKGEAPAGYTCNRCGQS
jgi:transcriptional regulator with XRE-family HTH domain